MNRLHGQELELSDYLPHLLTAANLRPGESVVDVGSGTGGPTVAAAYATAPGPVIGLDNSASAVTTARAQIPGELSNLTYVVADAETYQPETIRVDVVISRFGLMFFNDPTSAFTNIASWLRPGGRLVALIWQPEDLNPWSLAINLALTGDPSGTGTEASLPFSLGDRELLRDVLTQARFTEITLTTVLEPVHLGATVPDAVDFVLSLHSTQTTLGNMAPAAAEQARRSLARALAEHVQADGRVSLPSTAWLVQARATHET